MGSLQLFVYVFWQRDFLGTPVNLLLSSQKCQALPFSQICQKYLLLQRPPWCRTPFVRNRGASCGSGGCWPSGVHKERLSTGGFSNLCAIMFVWLNPPFTNPPFVNSRGQRRPKAAPPLHPRGVAGVAQEPAGGDKTVTVTNNFDLVSLLFLHLRNCRFRCRCRFVSSLGACWGRRSGPRPASGAIPTTRGARRAPTTNGHAPPPVESRKSYQSVNRYYVWTW